MLNSPDLSVGQPNLYSMRMMRRVGQQIFYNAHGQSGGSLVLFQDNGDGHSGLDILAFTVRHKVLALIGSLALVRTTLTQTLEFP
jgi:hypothetical protein